jgi:selenocysteine lyase/cysteine desulfurase
MLSCQKQEFSLPDGISYLNCAYMGPLPKRVENVGHLALSAKAQPFNISSGDFFTGPEKLRKLVGSLINVRNTDRITFTPSVSYGFANIIKNSRPSSHQEIIMVEETFPSNYYSWKRLADDTGASVRIIHAPNGTENRGRLWNEKILEAIGVNTFAVSVPQVHWADGTLFDLSSIRAKTRKHGALMVVDGSQSIGAMPFDVETLQPDALITVGYKWMFGPYGFGMAYFSDRFDSGIPIEENWINRLHSEDFQRLVNYQAAYNPGSQRYNVGEFSQFIAIPMLLESIELIRFWGVENIQEYCRKISKSFIEEIRNRGCFVEEENHRGNHLFGVRLPAGMDMEKLKKAAMEAKVFVSFRGNAVRISPHVYNEEADFEKLLKVFDSI